MLMTTAFDTVALLDRAAEMIDGGRTRAARPVLAAARESGASADRYAELIARLEMQEGDLAAARDALDQGIAHTPGCVALRKLRAELRLRLKDLPGALEDSAEGVILDPTNAAAKAILGKALLEAGQPADAFLCLREAVAADPDQPSFWIAAAAAQESMGLAVEAAATLEEACAHAAGHSAVHNAALLLAVRQRDFARAVFLGDRARRHGVADACVFGLTAHALSSLGRHDEAADMYAEARKLGPDDPYVRHLSSASGLVPSALRAPDEYIRAVFDGYADRFEMHLIELGYRIPGLLRAALLRCRPELGSVGERGPVLDLGCGTGLMAVVLSDLGLHGLVGVDLSKGMLASARGKALYDELHAHEITDFLRQDQRQFSIILAADVLCYFGELGPLLAAMGARLQAGGICLFSVEEAPDDSGLQDWVLGRQGRYMHRPDYVTGAVAEAGLRVLEARRDILRYEDGAALWGWLLAVERSS